MEETKDVTPVESPVEEQIEKEEVTEGTPDGGGSTNPPTPINPPGAKTPPELLLKALHEERAKRQELEDKLKNIPSEPAEPEVYSDEGKVLHQKYLSLQQELKKLTEEKEMERLQAQHPVLRDKAADFQQFKAAHPGYSPEDVAKLFIVDQGLSDQLPRKGLERRTSGTKVPTTDGYTAEEIAKLRQSNFRKYQELIQSGKVNFSELK